jgi:hypothetical protein
MRDARPLKASPAIIPQKAPSLNSLICDDLANLAYLHSDVVASEESINVLIHCFNKHKDGNNLQLVDILNLKLTLQTLFAKSDSNHYQLMIEFGNRSQIEKGNRGSAHYAALDIFIRHGKRPLLFLVDHFHGAVDGDIREICNKLNSDLVVVGDFAEGNSKLRYQTDAAHCPIFSLVHFYLSREDKQLLPLLESRLKSKPAESPGLSLIDWSELDPSYLIYAQSVKGSLFTWADRIKRKEGGPPESDSKLLTAASFQDKLAHTLVARRLVSDTSEMGLINKAIKYETAYLSGRAVLMLEDPGCFSGLDLAHICYKNRYPKVLELLAAVFKDYNDHHPLFELIFSEGHCYEKLLQQGSGKLFKILTNPLILKQMHLNAINPIHFCNQLTEKIAHDISLNTCQVNTVLSNSEFLWSINELLSSGQFDQKDISSLLFLKTTKSFFENTELTRLFLEGQIPVDIVCKIKPFMVLKDPCFQNKSAEQQLSYLHATYGSKEDEGSAGVAEVLMVPKISRTAIQAQVRPALNIALLCNGQGFFSESDEIDPNFEDNGLSLLYS